MLRRHLLAHHLLALGLAIAPVAASGQQVLPPRRPEPQKATQAPALPAPWPEPRAIITRLLNAYLERRAMDLSDFPLVHRLEQALARSDLGDDPVLGRQDFEKPESRLIAYRLIAETVNNEKRRSIEVWLKRTNNDERLVFDFDVTSGDWLIWEIRNARGYSLRRELHITR